MNNLENGKSSDYNLPKESPKEDSKDFNNSKNELYDFEFLSDEELSELDENEHFDYDEKLRKILEGIEKQHYMENPDDSINISDEDKVKDSKEDPGHEYFGRFIEYKNKTLKINKSVKTQAQKDLERIKAIKKAIAKREADRGKIGYIDPLDPTL